MSSELVLVVEDEPELARVLAEYLRQAGYEALTLSSGLGVVELVKARSPTAILLDLMLPGKNGLDVCREIRAFSSVPIIMVTARVDEIDRLLGLELGADDYVCKPFSPREVVARVKAVLRRMRPVDASAPTPAGLVIDDERMEIRVGANRVDLTPMEFRLLRVLAVRPGRVFSRAQLVDQLHADPGDVFDRAIDTHIKNIRKKLSVAAGPEGPSIRSVYGVGYKLES
jgi:two-component system response regulator BaeR